MLPSGRVLFFPKPHIDGSREGWLPQLAYKSYGMGKSFSKALYGGLIVENIVQAIARDLMCHAMLAMDRAGFSITMTVHDEIVCEEPEECSNNTEQFEKLMCTTPDWAEGIPVEVEGYLSHRYRK
jgi:DNA polymerase